MRITMTILATGLFYLFSPSAVRGDEKASRFFLDKQGVAILRIEKVSVQGEMTTHLAWVKLRTLSASVTIKSTSPASLLGKKKKCEITVAVYDCGYVRPGDLWLQEWFPTKPGDEVLVALDPTCTHASEMIPIAFGADVTPSWRDCQAFLDDHQEKEETVQSVVAKRIESKGEEVGDTFFRLVKAMGYHKQKPVALATARYVTNPKRTLDDRIVASRILRRTGDGETDKKVAAALVTLVLEADEQKKEASAILWQLGQSFIFIGSKESWPAMSADDRSAVRKIVAESSSLGTGVKHLFLTWLDGKVVERPSGSSPTSP